MRHNIGWGTGGRGAALFLLLATAGQAGMLFTSAGSHPLRYGDGFSLGSEFTDISSGEVAVTALGLYDTTGGGFFQSHDIGLWDHTAGDLEEAFVTIPAGTGATLTNGFRYVSLGAPLQLVQGHVYILAAFFPTGETAGVNDQLLDCCGAGSNAATDEHFGSFRAAFTGTGLGTSLGHLSEPNGFVGGTTDYVGPNLEFVTPEPGSFTLLVVGAAALGFGRIRRRPN